MNNCKPIEYVSSTPFNPEDMKHIETTAGASDSSGTWWNSQIECDSVTQDREYSIQFGTRNREHFKRVADLCAQIMDEEHVRRYY